MVTRPSAASSSATRLATASAPAASVPGSTSANSSPPMRNADPPSWQAPRSAWPATTSTLSPAAWPALSFTCLKPDQVRPLYRGGLQGDWWLVEVHQPSRGSSIFHILRRHDPEEPVVPQC